MTTLAYDFHGWLKVAIRNPARYGLADFNRKYAWFQVRDERPADLEFTLGDFQPDLRDTFPVDRKFFVREDYLYFEDSDKGLRWKVEITGLDAPITRVRVHYHPMNRLRWPWCLFPDMVLNLYVLQPLLEYKLAGKGIFVMHAAAVANGKGAVFMPGRGGTYKTTMATKMLDAGYSLLGDDLVFFDRERIHPCLMHRHFFHFYWKGMHSEDDLGFWNKARLGVKLLSDFKEHLPVADPAAASDLIVLSTRRRGGAARLSPLDREAAVGKMILNNRLEQTAYTSFKYRIGRFLEAYAMVFPECRYLRMERDSREALSNLIGNATCSQLEMPEAWSDDHARVVLNAVEAGG
jgi:hypothetical protein